MGPNEAELADLLAAGPFEAPGLADLRNSLIALRTTMRNVAGATASDSQGQTADAAADQADRLQRAYGEIDTQVEALEAQIAEANNARAAAIQGYRELPGAKAPDWVHDGLDLIDFPGIGPVDLAQGGLSLIEGFLGDRREEQAARVLQTYRDRLGNAAIATAQVREELAPTGGVNWSEHVTDIDDTAAPSGGPWGSPIRTPTIPGGSGGGPTTGGPTGGSAVGDPPPTFDVDDPNPGVVPGQAGSSSGTGGPGGLGGGSVGAGVGAGLGAGALGAATAVGAKFGIGGSGLGGGVVATGGAVARPAPGGLLGAAGMNGGASSAPGRTGATAARAGVGGGMLGGGAAGRGSGDRKRDAGRGLGGPLAPRLEDDEDYVPPTHGARAGGRDDPRVESD